MSGDRVEPLTQAVVCSAICSRSRAACRPITSSGEKSGRSRHARTSSSEKPSCRNESTCCNARDIAARIEPVPRFRVQRRPQAGRSRRNGAACGPSGPSASRARRPSGPRISWRFLRRRSLEQRARGYVTTSRNVRIKALSAMNQQNLCCISGNTLRRGRVAKKPRCFGKSALGCNSIIGATATAARAQPLAIRSLCPKTATVLDFATPTKRPDPKQ